MFTNVQYAKETRTRKDGTEETITLGVKADLDGVNIFIPMNTANRHYAKIMRQVEAGELTIQDAD